MISITAPGEDRLPWDTARCRHKPGGRCAGKRGCKIEDRSLRVWCESLTYRWSLLRKAARQAASRAGYDVPVIFERVWEPQRRGAPHVHIVVPFGDPAERAAAQALAEEFKRLAPSYDFGHVDTGRKTGSDGARRLRALTGAETARYLAHYLTGRSSRKASIRDNIADPRLPASLIWVTPQLTRVTLVTMRTLRRARHLWAHLDGLCDAPNWQDWSERVKVNAVYARLYMRRGPPELAEVLATIAAGEGTWVFA
jgi:hypothetical protein